MQQVVHLRPAPKKKDRVGPADASKAAVLWHHSHWDCGIALGMAGLVNLLMTCVVPASFTGEEHSRAGAG